MICKRNYTFVIFILYTETLGLEVQLLMMAHKHQILLQNYLQRYVKTKGRMFIHEDQMSYKIDETYGCIIVEGHITLI